MGPNMNHEKNGLPVSRKIAMLFILLGVEVAPRILKQLPQNVALEISKQMVRIHNISHEERNEILKEFYPRLSKRDVSYYGGLRFTKQMLQNSYGKLRAKSFLSQLTDPKDVPFHFFNRLSPEQIVELLRDEEAQTIALVLSFVDTENAAKVLSLLPQDLQAAIVLRMAQLKNISNELIERVAGALYRKWMDRGNTVDVRDSLEKAAGVLNRLDRKTEARIMEHLRSEDVHLEEQVKKYMFAFEDLVLMDDRSVQMVLREVDTKELALAMKSSSEALMKKIFRNLSDRAIEIVKEEMTLLGPVRKKDILRTQEYIVGLVLSLEEKGDIIIRGRGGGLDEVIN